MIDYFEENKRAFIILASLFFLLVIVLYFIVLRPQLNDVTAKKNSIMKTEQEITLLEKKLEQLEEQPEQLDIEELKLQNKIPLERDLDSYILWLEKLESSLDLKIESLNFAYDSNVDTYDEDELQDEIDEELGEGTEEITLPDEEELGELAEEEEETDEEIEPVIDQDLLAEKPEDLEVIVVRVVGHAKEFDHFIEFLEAIEAEERISFISRLSFSNPTRDDLLFSDHERIALSFEAELTTFYYKD